MDEAGHRKRAFLIEKGEVSGPVAHIQQKIGARSSPPPVQEILRSGQGSPLDEGPDLPFFVSMTHQDPVLTIRKVGIGGLEPLVTKVGECLADPELVFAGIGRDCLQNPKPRALIFHHHAVANDWSAIRRIAVVLISTPLTLV